MNSFNVTSNIEPENLRSDEAIVTLGIDSGNHPVFERRPNWRVESTLCYHFLVKKGTPEFLIVNMEFLPDYGAPYIFGEYEFLGWAATKAKIGLKKSYNGNPEYDYCRVDITYESLSPEPEGDGGNHNDRMPEPSENDPILNISRSTRIIQMAAWYDYQNKPVKNSADQLFNPSIMRDVPIESWSITRREYRNPHAKIDAFKYCVNSSPIWNGKYKPWEVWVENIDPKENRIDNSVARNWDVTYTLSVNTEKYGWKTAVLDMGTVQKEISAFPDQNGNANVFVPIRNNDNGPVSSPVMLNGEGKKLNTEIPNWQPVFEWANGSPFEFRYEKDLNDLKLPNPYL